MLGISFQIRKNPQDSSLIKIYSQADRFVDRKLDQAEKLMKNKGKAARKWYSNFVGDDKGPKLNEFHIFMLSFAAGVAVGIGIA